MNHLDLTRGYCDMGLKVENAQASKTIHLSHYTSESIQTSVPSRTLFYQSKTKNSDLTEPEGHAVCKHFNVLALCQP